jgi:hypothetical protein
MSQSAAPAPLDLFAQRFRERVARSRRQLGMALLFGAIVAGALVARIGTLPTRGVGLALWSLALAALLLIVLWSRRTLRNRERLLRATFVPAAPVVGAKALRALTLVERAEAGQTEESPDLARLHFQRLLTQVPGEAIERFTARVEGRTRVLLLGVLVAAATVLALDPHRVFEGLDVLAARDGRAPIPMFWVNSLHVQSAPPAYLRRSERSLIPSGTAYEPAGSTITFQGVPEHEGRKLVLVGDGREVPFVDDGAGGVLARWVLTRPVELTVAARFGDVLIPEAESLDLRVIADQAPRVTLEGAPRAIALRDLSALELRYDASDDYGLREIALVLRAGGREDRRTLERLDGEARLHRGAQALSPSDPFLRRSFLPVYVTVEARDNDGFAGSKWGESRAITLIPPGIGEGEAARFAAFKEVRSLLVDVLAHTLRDQEALARKDPSLTPELVRKQRQQRVLAVLAELKGFVETDHAGLSVPRSVRSFLLGQARALERPAATNETFVRRVEDVLLAADAALRATGNRDAEAVSKRLADVAEEVAVASKLGLDPEQRRASGFRLAAALPVLEQGAAALLSLSVLGADLGSVAEGETRRIKRALAAPSYLEAELAARHLAARLRRPKPSFSSAGGGGVEGGHGGGPPPPGEASQAHQQFQELMREMAQLAAEHAGEIAAVDNALREAQERGDDQALREEARRRAEALTEAFEGLPQYQPGQSPAAQAGALAREHGRAMAESMSRLGLKEAQESAQKARNQLSLAERAQAGQQVSPQALEKARSALAEQQQWIDELLKQAEARAQELAKEALERSAEREQSMAERAQNLSGRGRQGEAALPGEVAEALDRAEELMREAARELGQRRGERGLELQREAQRWLEQDQDSNSGGRERDQDQAQKSPREGDHDGDSGSMSMEAEVPGKDKNQRAEDFRRRVLEGLSRDRGDRLGPAVKRYAEGLLR